MSSENYKILLDYKSERIVTKHSLNRACVLLFWEVKLLSLCPSTVASTSKLYSYNTSIGNPKFYVSDASRRLFHLLFKGSKHGSSYRGWSHIENDLRGNENWFELAGVRVIVGFELPRVKLQCMYNENPGEIDFGWVNVRFKLVRIWVIGSRLYNRAASCYSRTKLSINRSWVNLLFSVLQDSILDLILDFVLDSGFSIRAWIENRKSSPESRLAMDCQLTIEQYCK